MYFIVIGVPVLLAIVGVVGTVGILYWAVKKGYIRHVPKAYSNFDNRVEYNSNSDAVHI